MKKRVFLWVQAILYIVLAALLSFGIIGIYREGVALRAAGDLMTPIFTREKVGHILLTYLPLILMTVAMTAAGWILHIRDERQNRPAAVDTSSCRPKNLPDAGYRRVVWLILMAAAVVFVFVGIQNGSMRDVLYKAVNICTECIGLG